METLIEDDRFDHLCPRVHADGSLYFIRRKWTPAARRASWLSVIKDMLLFPFRLARAFVHFFNFFSTTFSGKPLLTSGGPPQAPRETTSMMLWGKLIDAEKLMKDMQPDSAVALVPADWELMRLAKGGKPQVVARSVGSFDLTADGGVIYTNGAAVFTLGREGVQTTICTDRLIEGVWCWGAEG
jgi:hypothetical protein